MNGIQQHCVCLYVVWAPDTCISTSAAASLSAAVQEACECRIITSTMTVVLSGPLSIVYSIMFFLVLVLTVLPCSEFHAPFSPLCHLVRPHLFSLPATSSLQPACPCLSSAPDSQSAHSSGFSLPPIFTMVTIPLFSGSTLILTYLVVCVWTPFQLNPTFCDPS